MLLTNSASVKITVRGTYSYSPLTSLIFRIIESIGQHNGWTGTGCAKNTIVGYGAMQKPVISAPQQGYSGSCTIGNHGIIAG